MNSRQRLIRDESGVTMALAVIMIALFSVMGAGLLVFATSDLNTVVESNQGQRAFEMADAGVAAAQRQLTNDSTANKYDGGSNDFQWADSKGGVTLKGLDPTSPTDHSTEVTIKSETSSSGGTGQNAGSFDVGRRQCTGSTDAASREPVVNSFLSGETEYTVISKGKYGSARRIIEATFQIGGQGSGYSGFPMSTFSTGEVELGSGVKIECMSFFSMSNLKGGEISEGSNPTIDGVDLYYGNWYNPPWNSIPRPIDRDNTGSNKTAETEAGLGFLGKIKYGSSSDGKARVQDRRIDYSGIEPDNSPVSSTPLMANNVWAQDSDSSTVQPTDASSARVSFPFDPRPDSQITPAQLDELKQEAQDQIQYKNFGGNDAKLGSNLPKSWLDEADDVAYIEFDQNSGKKVEYPDACDRSCPQGTLVIVNGMFEPSTGAGHKGVIILRGTSSPDKQWFKAASSRFHMTGFINVKGNLTLQSDARIYPLPPDELDDYFPFSGINSSTGGGSRLTPKPIGWRECYNTACN